MKKEAMKFFYLGLIFIVIWTINILLISPNLTLIFNEPTAVIIRTIVKLVLWCGFSLYFIKKYDKDLSIKKDELFKLKDPKLLLKLLIMILIVAFISMLKNHGTFNINEFTIDDLFNKFLLVGIEEELIFRGLLLNGLSKKNSFIKASLITSVLFSFIHIPLYIRVGLKLSIILINCIKIICVSCIYNYIFKETKSLVPIIVVHSAWDLLFFMFVE